MVDATKKPIKKFSLHVRGCLLTLCTSAWCLSACEWVDNGGSSPENSDPLATNESADTHAVPDNDYCNEVQTWDLLAAEKEEEILRLTNEKRAQGADCGSAGSFPKAEPLSMNPHLRCAARKHSLDMVNRNYFDHVNPDGEDPGARIKKAGLRGVSWGENIAAGFPGAGATIEQWMESDGHCANVMRPEFRTLGVGYAKGGEWGHLWTQNFGG
jgi:uncharacterized protein YkwD